MRADNHHLLVFLLRNPTVPFALALQVKGALKPPQRTEPIKSQQKPEPKS
jgi:hypothetical protein